MFATPLRLRLALIAKIAAWVFIVGALVTVIPVFALRWINPPTSAFMLERRMQGVFVPSKRVHIEYQWVDLDRISRNAQLAVMASEDQKFLEHKASISNPSKRRWISGTAATDTCAAPALFRNRWRRISSSGPGARGCARESKRATPC